MSPLWREIIWHQFGAAIDTLQNALNACPEELWHASLWRESDTLPKSAAFWYLAYHTIFYIDYYSSESADEFTANDIIPTPSTLSEFEMNPELPERVYTKQELQDYLEYARTKCHARIARLADENEPQRFRNNWRIKTVAELLLYNMRHVQEHAAQLNMLLGQHSDSAPGWVAQATMQ